MLCATSGRSSKKLLRPIYPKRMERYASDLEALGEYLGDDHDLVVLRQTLEEQSGDDRGARAFETLDNLIGQRQGELRSAAMTLGARFYAEKPSIFCDRLAGYWRTWRHRKKSLVKSAV